jgi:hypothetical protein
MAARVLITGSRTWVNAAVIRDALLEVWGDGGAVLVSGGCPQGATGSRRCFGPAGAGGSSGIRHAGRLTDARRGSGVMPRWSCEALMSAWRLSGTARTGPATPPD